MIVFLWARLPLGRSSNLVPPKNIPLSERQERGDPAELGVARRLIQKKQGLRLEIGFAST